MSHTLPRGGMAGMGWHVTLLAVLRISTTGLHAAAERLLEIASAPVPPCMQGGHAGWAKRARILQPGRHQHVSGRPALRHPSSWPVRPVDGGGKGGRTGTAQQWTVPVCLEPFPAILAWVIAHCAGGFILQSSWRSLWAGA